MLDLSGGFGLNDVQKAQHKRLHLLRSRVFLLNRSLVPNDIDNKIGSRIGQGDELASVLRGSVGEEMQKKRPTLYGLSEEYVLLGSRALVGSGP